VVTRGKVPGFLEHIRRPIAHDTSFRVKKNKECENKERENKERENKERENKERENKERENKERENKERENKEQRSRYVIAHLALRWHSPTSVFSVASVAKQRRVWHGPTSAFSVSSVAKQRRGTQADG
jgi:ABC-type Zn2+ transport system substrate-binding protein/surface adhesin